MPKKRPWSQSVPRDGQQDKLPSLPIQHPPNHAPGHQPHNNSKRNRRRGRRKRNARNENNALDPLPTHRDERQRKQRVLGRDALEAALSATRSYGFLKDLDQLRPPLGLHLADAEQRGADDGNDDCGHQVEGAFVVVLGFAPDVAAEAVEGAYDGAADGQAEQEAEGYAGPDLSAILRRGVWLEGVSW